MKRLTILACLALIVSAGAAWADPVDRDLRGYEFVDGNGYYTNSDASMFAKSGVDTVCLLGDDGDLRGDFENAQGLPNWDDWYGVDLTLILDSQWHIDTYNCANLDRPRDLRRRRPGRRLRQQLARAAGLVRRGSPPRPADHGAC